MTVRGRNFVGKVAVLFGTTPSSRVHVLSASEITVTAPAGSGTVMSGPAVGGTSRRTSASKYHLRTLVGVTVDTGRGRPALPRVTSLKSLSNRAC